MGFKIEDDLNTEHSRQLWLEWKRRIDPQHYLDPQQTRGRNRRVQEEMIAEGLLDRIASTGRSIAMAMNAKGEVCGVTTTSGLSWKIPGRVGDSPILGAGLYVDGEIGAAGSTGRGEANLYNLCSFYDRGEHAPRHASERRGHGRVQTHQGEHGRETFVEQPRPAEFQHQLLRLERERRIRGRRVVSRGSHVCGLH